MPETVLRSRLSFRSVNRPGEPGYDSGLQRHHLLPCQLLSLSCFSPMLDSIGADNIGYDDFRSNGLLLPAHEDAAIRLVLPLHRGPHRHYNSIVIERVGQIERNWSEMQRVSSEVAADIALMQMRLLQRALRRRLFSPPGRRFTLNRRDPLCQNQDYSDLDAMADALWGATGAIQGQVARHACITDIASTRSRD